MTTIHEQGDCVHFPFLQLPPELRLRILKYVLQDPRQLKYYDDPRLICRAVRDIVDNNRRIVGGIRAKRVIIGQHSFFDRFPKRFVMSEPSQLPECLDTCRFKYIEETFFYMISFSIQEIFYEANFRISAQLIKNICSSLLNAGHVAHLVMIECQLPEGFVDSLMEMFRWRCRLYGFLREYFVGSADSFEVYFRTFDFAFSRIKWAHSVVTETLGPARVTSSGEFSAKQYRVHRNADYVRDISVICTKTRDLVPYPYDINIFQVSGGSLYTESVGVYR
ncbi:unnamed protein product [Cylicocyclus nassatus]|uniref:F-box domain-containing protein n=1 Tax=Cylicocyclus nassatus TaxID=53992 RepID=A0AA36GN69_CYLNA|nr:unnamed protein product [Cylicocyclus nassatus]